MSALIHLFLDICLFRKGPQDLPSSPALLKLSLAFYGISGILILLIEFTQLNAFYALFLILFDIALLVGLLYGALHVLGYTARFSQTLAALAGVVALLQIITIPLAVWAKQEVARNNNPGLPSLISLFLLGWAIAVMAHILQHAFSTSRNVGLLYAVAYFAISLMMSNWLLPASTR